MNIRTRLEKLERALAELAAPEIKIMFVTWDGNRNASRLRIGADLIERLPNETSDEFFARAENQTRDRYAGDARSIVFLFAD